MNDQELAELDLAVAKAEGHDEAFVQSYWYELEVPTCVLADPLNPRYARYRPTRDGAEAMRLLVKYEMVLMPPYKSNPHWSAGSVHAKLASYSNGPTPAIAICRAVVAIRGPCS